MFATYANPRGRALIDRRLYLPQSWCDDRDRCDAAGIPADVTFATKPQLATQMLTATLKAGVPFGWVTADEAYGVNTAFCRDLRERGISYVLAVSCRTQVDLAVGRRRVDTLVAALPATAWQPYSAGAGSKGPRTYDWAWVRLAATSPDRWLLVRRNTTTGELAYYLAWSPTPHPLRTLARVAGSRWATDEAFQAAKGNVGLDHYQVRNWTAWHRHITLCMVALAFLVTVTAAANTQPPPNESAGPRPFLPDPKKPIAVTVAEARRLLAALIIEPVRNATHILRWSRWRRLHQAAARYHHYRRRIIDP